jgi:hypothetical protein
VNGVTSIWSYACAVSGACGSSTFTNVAIDNSNADDVRLAWPGVDYNNPSGYGFARASTPFSVDLSSGSAIFALGNFTHYNFIIPPNNPSGTLATADLDVTFGLMGANPGSISETYGFEHWETNNGANPCPGAFANPCPDRVTFINTSSVRAFAFEGKSYNLRLAGFSQDGGMTLTDSFWSSEGGTNSATLYASIEVPEPASAALVVTGAMSLFGLGLRRRKTQI